MTYLTFRPVKTDRARTDHFSMELTGYKIVDSAEILGPKNHLGNRRNITIYDAEETATIIHSQYYGSQYPSGLLNIIGEESSIARKKERIETETGYKLYEV